MDLPRTSHYSFKRSHVRFILFSCAISVLAGCHQSENFNLRNSDSQNSPAQESPAQSQSAPAESQNPRDIAGRGVKEKEKENRRESSTLPTMSAYTLKRLQQSRETDSASSISTGHELGTNQQYCFQEASGSSWLSIRLTTSAKQQLTGEVAGIVNHPKRGETPYQQTFDGTLEGKLALVDVETTIAGITKKRQETWEVTTKQLDMGRVVISQVPCLEIATDF